MIDYQSTVLGRTDVAEGTMAFQFEKPHDFVFKAGHCPAQWRGNVLRMVYGSSPVVVGQKRSLTHVGSC
jgi:hypothetical protein